MRIFASVLLLAALTACTSIPIQEGRIPESYTPTAVEAKNSPENPQGYSTLVGAVGQRETGWMKSGTPYISLRLVNPKEKPKSFLKKIFSTPSYENSLKVPSGKIDLYISYSDMNGTAGKKIWDLNVEPGKTYLVNFKKNERRVTFWIEDTDSNKVVYGRKPEE